jgi:hypothetical protein
MVSAQITFQRKLDFKEKCTNEMVSAQITFQRKLDFKEK